PDFRRSAKCRGVKWTVTLVVPFPFGSSVDKIMLSVPCHETCHRRAANPAFGVYRVNSQQLAENGGQLLVSLPRSADPDTSPLPTQATRHGPIADGARVGSVRGSSRRRPDDATRDATSHTGLRPRCRRSAAGSPRAPVRSIDQRSNFTPSRSA